MAEDEGSDRIAVLGQSNPARQDRRYVGESLDKDSLVGRIHDLSKLPRDWNGYGAAPIDPAVIRIAERFVSDLPIEWISAPQVVPMTRGRLQLEWHRGDRSL